jgi:DNA-binding transcriptional LysR family regulator
MELRHLTYFVAVAEDLSFTRAAARVHVAQSALSQQIARLEKDVGATLFSRTSRSVRLTAAGELLLPLARRILADVETAQSELDALAGLRRGRLRLGLIQTAAMVVDVFEILSTYRRRYSEVDMHVVNQTSAEMIAAVRAGQLDVAIAGIERPPQDDGLEYHPMEREPLVVVLPDDHGLAGRTSIGLDEIPAELQVIHFAQGTGLRGHVEAAFRRAGVEPDTRFEVSQVADMIRLAAAGVGVTVLPRSAVCGPGAVSSLPHGVAVVALSDERAVHHACLVHDPLRLSSAAEAFVNIVKKTCSL